MKNHPMGGGYYALIYAGTTKPLIAHIIKPIKVVRPATQRSMLPNKLNIIIGKFLLL